MTGIGYADASALVKLVVDEPGSAAVGRWYLESDRVLTSVVGIVEMRRACARRSYDAARLEAIVRSVDVVAVTSDVAERAGALRPSELRTLDAIHLATALALGADLETFITYDTRLAAAAQALAIRVVSPI